MANMDKRSLDGIDRPGHRYLRLHFRIGGEQENAGKNEPADQHEDAHPRGSGARLRDWTRRWRSWILLEKLIEKLLENGVGNDALPGRKFLPLVVNHERRRGLHGNLVAKSAILLDVGVPGAGSGYRRPQSLRSRSSSFSTRFISVGESAAAIYFSMLPDSAQ